MASKRKVLVQTVKWDVKLFNYNEFFLIDFATGEVTELPDVLLADSGLNSMVACGSAVYLVGGEREVDMPCPRKPPNSTCNKNGIYHKGISYMDLTQVNSNSGDVCVWKEAPCHVRGPRRRPSVAALSGKIYVFHTGGFSPSAEVFDSVSNQWETLLPPPEMGSFDALYKTSAVADPDNNRILLHFYRNPSLFAYYPHGHNPRWELVMSPCTWSSKQVVVDGVIIEYLPEDLQLVAAFHLPTQEELNVVFTSEVPVKIWRYEFDNIISLGNGLLSLVSHSIFRGDDHSPPRTEVYFAKFSFERPPHRPADILISPPLSFDTFTLNDRCEVRNYLPI